MAISGVRGLATAAIAPAAANAAAASSAADGAPFGDLLRSALGGVDQLQQQAAGTVAGVLAGDGVDIHDAMIATQKADMAFEMALAVRNKAVAAYQQVMGMQF
jgi:flagellar hook-basal body complex protein FliE